ncbi:S66 peptidase family protein [Haloimpatiens lingqiaonensis]|uniref:S66 peptidase family protein n=1 Tax=Haloimpatiens lingqiaonensis TaxID=1380675 RepID=UPI0010FE538E|nr:LD-carboxypeptidase [Haloimpatiens lingqiaonensis]
MLGNKFKIGDTIGIVAPSGPENKENILQNIDIFTSLGFKIKLAKNIFNRKGYLAGTDEERVSDLMEMFKDKNVDIIMCLRGGYGSSRLLPLIDWSIIKNNPKIFIGYSDITILLNEIYRRCNLITFHGPMFTSNLKEKHTLESLLTTLQQGFKPYSINSYDIHVKSSVNYITEGFLVGGNLSLICSTLGTPYEINTTEKILFLEEIGEEPYKIDRMLTQLHEANKLEKCRGFILGHFTNCDTENPANSLSLNEVIKDKILSLNKPTLFNFPSGHDYPNITLPIGAKIRLNCIKCKIDVLEGVVGSGPLP